MCFCFVLSVYVLLDFKLCARGTIRSHRLYKTVNSTRIRRALAKFSPLQYTSGAYMSRCTNRSKCMNGCPIEGRSLKDKAVKTHFEDMTILRMENDYIDRL